MSTERRYSEKEMRAIFERAARRQRPGDVPGDRGLTLADLLEIGAAAGFDPADVAAAAAELRAGPAASPKILGMTREVTRTRVLRGPVTDEAWGALVAELRRTFGATGTTSQVGRVREWASAISENEVPVRASLEPEGDGVRLTLTQRSGEIVAVLASIIPGIMGLLGLLGLLFGRDGMGVGLGFILLAVVAHLVVRFAYERSVRRTGRRFEETLDRAEVLLRPAVAVPLADAAPLSHASQRLDLDALPDAASSDVPASVTRTRA